MMKILLYHPVLLPPKDYGGTERVVLWLAKGLIERGHQVFIAALEGSRLPKGCEHVVVEKKNYTLENLQAILPKSLDVIHFMAPIEERVWHQLPCPALLTVHGNGKPGETFPKNTVFLSKNHAERHQGKVFIYNGIDPIEYQYAPENLKLKESWYFFLSKTNWSVKNLAGAMRYCKQANVPLKIAGGRRPYLRRLECYLRPSLEWIGPVSAEKKANYLVRAKALIFPVLWPEPFGLVVAEALMSGTPVIASPRGSLEEIIPPEVGILPRSDEEWVETLMKKDLLLNPERCRQWALEKFHYSLMAENYEKVYRQVGGGELLHVQSPRGGDRRTG